MHPYTPLTLATCFMITITVLNDTVASAVGLGIAIIIGVAARRWKIFAATLAMALPAALSFGLMYGLFGQWQSAAELSLRFAAILSGGLVLLSFIRADDLLRAMSPSVPAPFIFIVGSITRMTAQATERLHTIEQIQRSRGMKVRRLSWNTVILPLIVGMVTDAAVRSRPLQRTGISRPGPRTVLYPVADRMWEKIVRILCIIATAALSIWVVIA